MAILSVCTDLSGDAFALGDSLQRSMCEAGNGTFAMNTACPSENRLGSCQIEGGQLRRYYSGGNLMYDAADAESDWTAPSSTRAPGPRSEPPQERAPVRRSGQPPCTSHARVPRLEVRQVDQAHICTNSHPTERARSFC